nr:unnamed protein product [Callosobruchus analis]
MPSTSGHQKDTTHSHKQQPKRFNCGQRGHVASKCFKRRLECGKCKPLGHEEKNCPKNKQEIPGESKPILNLDLSQSNDTNTCYFIDCSINNHVLRGYVDSGSKVVTLVRLGGYACGSVLVRGKVYLNLKVNLAMVPVEALIVPDSSQNVSVIVEQPFINHPEVVMVAC